MSLTYKIKTYETDTEDSSKTRVGFYVTDAQDNKLAIDRLVTTGSKSKQEIINYLKKFDNFITSFMFQTSVLNQYYPI